METQSGEIKEVEPRSKILFINMGPTEVKPSFQIASGMFENTGSGIQDFSEMMLTKIKSPGLLEGESSGSLRQSKESSLLLPSLDDVTAIVITGSSFSAALLKRDLSKFGIDREGKGVFLPNWQKELADYIKEASKKGKPMLGICFGAEMIAEALGGKVEQMGVDSNGKNIKEVGYVQIHKVVGDSDPLLNDAPDEFVGIANNNREIVKLPDGAQVLAKSKYGIQAFRIGKMWGLQFHPEKTAENAEKMLTRKENQGKYDPVEQRELSVNYSREVGTKILSNFLKFSQQNLQ